MWGDAERNNGFFAAHTKKEARSRHVGDGSIDELACIRAGESGWLLSRESWKYCRCVTSQSMKLIQ